MGVTAEATRHSHPYPGVRYLPVTGAEPVTVPFLAPATATHSATAAFLAHARRCLSDAATETATGTDTAAAAGSPAA